MGLGGRRRERERDRERDRERGGWVDGRAVSCFAEEN